MFNKTVPHNDIIKLLTEEIKSFALPFAKTKQNLNMTINGFDSFKNSIPKIFDNTKASLFYGTYDMGRKKQPVIESVKQLLNADECTNTLYYSAGSCIDWHTNSDMPGLRTYILYTNKPGIFRYQDPKTGEIIDDYDYVGWTQRQFLVDKQKPLWHCVYSPSPRFAYGFNRR